MSAGEPLLRVDDLHVHYPVRGGLGRRRGVVKAVDGVSFDLVHGEILALVGESGCGKTSIARAVMRLVEPTAGRILFKGQDITRVRGQKLRRLRREFQLIFQDPFESLDPRRSVYETVVEPLVVHGLGGSEAERRQLALRALETAGLHPPERIATRYPHELSGGQRQRVAVASAMILDPSLLVADEPVSMLDVSLRAGILKLMLDLRGRKNLSYLFITHDLSLAWVLADRIAVVYLGRIVEIGSAADVIATPRHPYTKALVSVVPVPEAGAASEQIVLSGETPSAISVPSGCRFHPRCYLRQRLGDPMECTSLDPALDGLTGTPPDRSEAESAGDTFGEGAHLAACHFQGRDST